MDHLYNRKDNRTYKCFVPNCSNSRTNNPTKVFVHVNSVLKRKWCEQVHIPHNPRKQLYCCEDHLNLEEDLENYNKWKWTKCSPRLKKTVILQYNQENKPIPSFFRKTYQPPRPPCSSCLSYGRNLQPLQPLGKLTELYCTLVPAENNPSDVLICWECRGALRSCARFQQKAMRTRDLLTEIRQGKKAKITDNSRSLSTLAKVDVAYMSMGSEQEENITAISEETNVQESKQDDPDTEVLSAINVNTKTAKHKQRKDNNIKDTSVFSVKMEEPAIMLEEPLCEIKDVKIEVEDPLEYKSEECTLITTSEKSNDEIVLEKNMKNNHVKKRKMTELNYKDLDICDANESGNMSLGNIDNSRSLSTLAKVDEAYMSMGSEQEENITAISEETNVQENKQDDPDTEVLSAINVNTKTVRHKQRKDNNIKDTSVFSVEMEEPAIMLEEPLCEIKDVKIEVEDPLEYKSEECTLITTPEKSNDAKILEKNMNKKNVKKRKMTELNYKDLDICDTNESGNMSLNNIEELM